MRTFWLGIGKRWRGVAIERTFFGPVFRFGWLSVGYSKYDLPDWIRSWRNALEAAKRGPARASGSKGQQS